jgi:FAD/FMN-containing dehydrogenase
MFDRSGMTRRHILGSVAGVAAATQLGAGWSAVLTAATPALDPIKQLKGKIFLKGSDMYEPLRDAAVWNALKPERYPNAVVMAESADDVVAAVRLAKAKGWKVGTRAGGHSWDGSHTRDNAVLISLARMNELVVDPIAKIAKVSPSWKGHALGQVLRDKYQLMTPTAHGWGVGIGGFIMNGGHGWNSIKWGMGCQNLLAIDLVTADGELIHASAIENPDYYWAARGAGAGFFGSVVRYYLRLHPYPKCQRNNVWTIADADIDETIRWIANNQHKFPNYVETFATFRNRDGGPKTLSFFAHIHADNEAEVDAGYASVRDCPTLARALKSVINEVAVLPAPTESPNTRTPTGARYYCDGAWIEAGADEAAALYRKSIDAMPVGEAFFFMQTYAARTKLEDMAYSVQADLYMSPTAVWRDPADDFDQIKWIANFVSDSRPISVGQQMNDDNMLMRNRLGLEGRYFSLSAKERLKAMQAKYDPNGMFGFLIDINMV